MPRPTSLCGFVLILIIACGVTASHRVLGWHRVSQWHSRTVMGTGDESPSQSSGLGTATHIGQPFGVEVLRDGRVLVTEVSHHRIWAFDPSTGECQVILGSGRKGYDDAGGAALEIAMDEPYEVRESNDGSLYWVEMRNHIVRRWDPTTDRVETIAGTGMPGFGGDGGPARDAQLQQPHSLVIDEQRRQIYVADIGNHRIRAIDLNDGTIRTLAGNGERVLPREGQPIENTPVLGPRALAIDTDRLWVALREGHSLWSIDLTAGTWHHAAGRGSRGFQTEPVAADQAMFDGPKGIALTPDGRVAIVDTENHAIRLYDPKTQTVSTLSGAGPASRGSQEGESPAEIQMNRPHGIAIDSEGAIHVGDSENHRLRVLLPTTR
ncbi:MAG: hypothetical protein R3B96_00880 [Pirellulaceae bacterium]